MQTIVANDKGL